MRRHLAEASAPILVAAWLLAAALPLVGAPGRHCYDCHKDLPARFSRKVVHEPVAKRDCLACHKSHGFSQRLILSAEPPALCETCHPGVRGTGDGGSHPPFREGQCTSCHDPHASDAPHLVRLGEDGALACFGCHQEIGQRVAAPGAHPPARAGDCARCHEPHEGGTGPMLRQGERALCASCHTPEPRHEGIVTAGLSCSDCHDPHGAPGENLVRVDAHRPFASGECAACHAPGPSPGIVGEARGSESCWNCHEEVRGGAVAAKASHPPAAEGDCLLCHVAHRGPGALLAGPQAEVCGNCHSATIAAEGGREGSRHAPFASGECSSCHDAHGSQVTGLLRSVWTDLCRTCHEGKGLSEPIHAALENGCESCHLPHVSERPRLLSQPEGELCAACHEETRTAPHQAVSSGVCDQCHDPHGGPKFVRSGPELARSCTGCHPEILRYLRNIHVHEPFRQGECEVCHAPHGSAQPAGLRASQAELCGTCHTEEVREGDTLAHAPVKAGKCSACHDPHGSEAVGLLKKPTPDLCFGCHDAASIRPDTGEVHPPVAEGKCGTCHDPHGRGERHLLTGPEPALCAGCHDPSSAPLVEAHAGKDLAGARCTSCHDPHASPAPHLVKGVEHAPFEAGDCSVCHGESPLGEETPEGKPAIIWSPQVTMRCDDCHGEVTEWKARRQVHAPFQTDECTGCHEPHAAALPALLDVAPPDLCARCHEELVATAKTSGPAGHRNCLGCHEQHASDGRRPLMRGGSTPPCLSCHESLAKQVASGRIHPPLRDPGCGACHAIHSTGTVSLLKEDQGTLCARCHETGSATLLAAHRGRKVAGEECTSCHDPHGGGGDGLLRAQVHPPFGERECGACHEEIPGKPLGKASSESCRACHEEKFTASNHAARTEGCTACHSPHAGFTPALGPARTEVAICTRCHDPETFSHANRHAEGGACHLCHDPHGESASFLLRPLPDLCTGCHEISLQHTHPMGEGAFDPRNGKPLTCVSCHAVHSSDYRFLLAKDPRRALCLECHSPFGERTTPTTGTEPPGQR